MLPFVLRDTLPVSPLLEVVSHNTSTCYKTLTQVKFEIALSARGFHLDVMPLQKYLNHSAVYNRFFRSVVKKALSD